MKKLVTFLQYAILSIGLLLIGFPIYLTIATAMKTPQQSSANFFAPPESWYFENFITVVHKAKYFAIVWNSTFITVVGAILIAIIIPMTSYAIASNPRKRYYTLLYTAIVLGIFVPFQVKMVPMVRLMSTLRLMSPSGLIILYIAGALTQGVFLMTSYIKTIPKSLEEAAYIDGCTTFDVFVKIIYPLAFPMTATLIIINSLWMWNDFLMPLLLLNRKMTNWTLPLFLYNFKTQYSFDYNLAFAAITLSILPILVLYAFIQRKVINGLTSGAIKG